MPAEVRDVLKINIVLVGLGLLNSPEEANAFSEAVGSDAVLTEAGLVFGFPPGAPEPGRKLALQRDRINIDLSPARTIIEREFPTENDLNRLAEVAAQAVTHTPSREGGPLAFGYNIELVYDQMSGHPSLHYLGTRLFGKSSSIADDWNLIGGAGRLLFDSPAGRWTIQVEPRFNDPDSTRVFLSLNLHKAESRIPDLDEMRRSFVDVWGQAHDFVKSLDESIS